MTNNYPNEAASPAAAGLDFRMDRRTKKPVMEKQRRDRMNRAMDDLKTFLLKYDPAHTSKLEKADILERTVELIRRLEMERASPNNPRAFAEGYFRGTSEVCLHLRSKSTSPEVQRLVNDVMMSMRSSSGLPMPPQPCSMPMPPPQAPNGQMVRPMMPPMPGPFFMPFPGMSPMQIPPNMASLKFPVATPPPGIPFKKPEEAATTTTTTTLSDPSVSDEVVDVENVDDETFSAPGSPETRARCQKRKLSSTDDDSGISEPSPKRCSPVATIARSAFSIDNLLISKT